MIHRCTVAHFSVLAEPDGDPAFRSIRVGVVHLDVGLVAAGGEPVPEDQGTCLKCIPSCISSILMCVCEHTMYCKIGKEGCKNVLLLTF